MVKKVNLTPGLPRVLWLWPWLPRLRRPAVSRGVGACECLCVCPCACMSLVRSLRKVLCLEGGVGATQPPQEEARKSFVESVDEIPFADDVEDTYDDNTCDDRTEDSSLQETFFTPPSHWPHPKQPLAPENSRGPESGVPLQKRGLPLVSAEAKAPA